MHTNKINSIKSISKETTKDYGFDVWKALASIETMSTEDDSEGFKEVREQMKIVIKNNRKNMNIEQVAKSMENKVFKQRIQKNNLPSPEYYQKELHWELWNKVKDVYETNPMNRIIILSEWIKHMLEKIKNKKWEVSDSDLNYIIICSILKQWFISKMERVVKYNRLGTRTDDEEEIKNSVKDYENWKEKMKSKATKGSKPIEKALMTVLKKAA